MLRRRNSFGKRAASRRPRSRYSSDPEDSGGDGRSGESPVDERPEIDRPGEPPEGERPPPDARDSALRLLARREHSARELQRKLADRGVEESDAAEAIEALASRDLQSDQRYADQLIRTRIAHGYGPVRIQAELRQAGLSGDEIETAMAAADCDWQQLAADAHAKKFRALPRSMAERNKHYRFLMGRGFDSEQIRRVLKGDADG